MTSKTRFLTGGLAALAIASAVTLSTPAANAADLPGRGCGQPAVPAAYTTLTIDPVVRLVPAVTHDEWRWERVIEVFAHEYAKVVTPAYTEADWSRQVPGTVEYEWTRTVIDRAAVDAVPGTPEVGHTVTVVVTPAVTRVLVEYQQQQTGALRWEPEGWNGEKADRDAGRGWTLTGRSLDDVVTPAVTEQHWVVDEPGTEGTPAVEEISHVEHLWSAASPGGGWAASGESHTVGGGTETATTDGASPAGSGWELVQTRTHPAVVDVQWALEAPEGYSPTGNDRPDHVLTEQTDGTSATAPADGWSQVPDSQVVVVDQPETTEIVGVSRTEQVLLSPAADATPPCPATAGGAIDAPSAAGPRAHTAGAVSAAQAGTHSGTHPGTGTAAVTSSTGATVLPPTGNPVSPLLLTTGLGALLAGGVLVGAGRRRHAD